MHLLHGILHPLLSPIAKDVILSMVSLDYDDTIMAAAGEQAEAALEDTIRNYKGNYILAVEGNIPLGGDGTFCIPGGETFLEKIQHVAHDAKAVIGWDRAPPGGAYKLPNPTPRTPFPSRKSSPTNRSSWCRAVPRFLK